MERERLRFFRFILLRMLAFLGCAFLVIAALVTALFWTEIDAHVEFIIAIAITMLACFGVALYGYIHFSENFINPLIDLGRAARAQKILGIPLNAETYRHTMVMPLAQILEHHEEGDLARANTDEAREWAHQMGGRKLRDLNFVVFDTETTGLNPQAHDQILQIGAVRVKEGKVDARDYYASYANPGMSIPRSSTKIHGIDNKRVANAHPVREVVQSFRDWSGQDVLVAHNAAFDMAFLRKTGIVFDHYVLDTVFMSAFLFDHTGTHTLDALTDRLQVDIPDALRHDAHGDAIGTAEVFAKLLPLLEERGVVTLDDAIALGLRMRKIRRAQAIYG